MELNRAGLVKRRSDSAAERPFMINARKKLPVNGKGDIQMHRAGMSLRCDIQGLSSFWLGLNRLEFRAAVLLVAR